MQEQPIEPVNLYLRRDKLTQYIYASIGKSLPPARGNLCTAAVCGVPWHRLGDFFMQQSKTHILVEGAICVAMTAVLSLVMLFVLPGGGVVTLFGMTPVLVFAYRRGVWYGLLVGGVVAVINALYQPYFLHPMSVLLDYVLPFMAVGLVGIFGNKTLFVPLRATRFCLGVAVYFGVRCFCHTLSGVLFWSDAVNFWVWEGDLIGSTAWAYSFVYNVSYLLPDTLLALLGGIVVIKVLRR